MRKRFIASRNGGPEVSRRAVMGSAAATALSLTACGADTSSTSSAAGQAPDTGGLFSSDFSLDFRKVRFRTPAGTVADLVASGLIGVKRGGVSYVQDSDGSYRSFGADTARVTGLGLLVERAAFTPVNNQNAGAIVSPLPVSAVLAGNSGTLPRGWSAILASGVVFQVLDTWIDPVTRLPRTRLRLTGTPAKTTTCSIRFCPAGTATGAPPIALGDMAVGSCFVAFPNMTAAPATAAISVSTFIGNAAAYCLLVGDDQVVAGSSQIAARSAAAVPLTQTTPQRFETYAALVTGAVETVSTAFDFDVVAGQPVDFVVDLIMPQLETVPDIQARATSPITGTAATTTAAGAPGSASSGTSLAVTSALTLFKGQVLSGAGIAAGTTISDIAGNILTLSKAAVVTAGATVTAIGGSRGQDVIAATGTLLDACRSPAATVRVTLRARPYRPSYITRNIKGLPGIARRRLPILGFNGNATLLASEIDGAVKSGLRPGLQTFKAFAGNWALGSPQAVVSWNAAGAGIASSAGADSVEVAGAPAAITSVQIGSDGGAATLDGFIEALTVTSEYAADLATVGAIAADIVVYGAKPGGIIAACRAACEGRSVVISGDWREHIVGGMMSGGLGYSDVVTEGAYGGLARAVFSRANAKIRRGNTGLSCFPNAPRVFQSVFEDMLAECRVPVYWTGGVTAVSKSLLGSRITRLKAAGRTIAGRVCSPKQFTPKVVIGADYEGDILPLAGISHAVGREANATYNEFRNGFTGIGSSSNGGGGAFQLSLANATTVSIDPFVTPGAPLSGVLTGAIVYPGPVPANGTADPNHTQAYNFRLIMTNTAARKVPIFAAGAATNPLSFGWTPAWAELYIRYIKALNDAAALQGRVFSSGDNNSTTPGEWGIGDLFSPKAGLGELANIYDVNARGGLSLDYVGGNVTYIADDRAGREAVWQDHINYVLRLWWTLQYADDPRIPPELQAELRNWGWDTWHFRENLPGDPANFPPQLYVREGRRMKNADFPIAAGNASPVYNENDVSAVDGTIPRDVRAIGAVSYGLDSHPMQRYVSGNTVWAEGWVNLFAGAANNNKGPVFGADMIGPLPLAAILPARAECSNYCSPFHVAASHAAFSAFRMEASSMAAGEAAGLLAAMAIEQKVDIQAVAGSWTDASQPGSPRQRLMNTANTGAPTAPVAPLWN